MKRIGPFCLILGILLISGCNQSATTPPSATSLPIPAESRPPAAPQEAPATPSSTATREALIPAEWATYTSQPCAYTISHPAEMEVTSNGAHSRILGFKLPDPNQGARNFVYVSAIPVDLQISPADGVYNYDPAEADILLNLQIGESKPVREVPNVAAGFTYQRQPDTMISGRAARTYENVQPWEFPAGTKELRHYVSLNGCTYLMGGYLDTAGSNQPGAITEDLFHRIIATVQLMP